MEKAILETRRIQKLSIPQSTNKKRNRGTVLLRPVYTFIIPAARVNPTSQTSVKYFCIIHVTYVANISAQIRTAHHRKKSELVLLAEKRLFTQRMSSKWKIFDESENEKKYPLF